MYERARVEVMRTTVADCIRLCVSLVRASALRRHMRIGQILFNAITDEDPHNKVFYIENNRLVASVARYGRVTEYRKILRTKRT